jgi:hypothetical protein
MGRERDSIGRWTAITTISPVPLWWRVWLAVNFCIVAFRRRIGRPSRVERNLRSLAFIGFAHWGVFHRVPARGVPWQARRLPHHYLLFESNFNGAGAEYIEAFCRVITLGIEGLWRGAYQVPPPLPVTPFQRHIEERKLPTGHYYTAYPNASTKMVKAALELRPKLAKFARDSRGLEPHAFQARYERFISGVQGLI